MLLRRIPAPVLTATLVALVATMVVFWGRAGRNALSVRTATISNVRADLADAKCVFTADVQLHSGWQQWVFNRTRLEARRAFVSILRTKRRYMVESAVARQALGAEMAYTINRLARATIAERVEFPAFELY